MIHSLLTAFSSTPTFSPVTRGTGRPTETAPPLPGQQPPLPLNPTDRGPDTVVELSPQARQAAEQQDTVSLPGQEPTDHDHDVTGTDPTPAGAEGTTHDAAAGENTTNKTAADKVVDDKPTGHGIGDGDPDVEKAQENESGEAKSSSGQPLTDEEQKQIDELKKRDQEVRQHEQAHKAAAGPYAQGGSSFSYQTGPDGRKYAVGGSVQIDSSPIPGDPEATIRKMEVVQRAAQAPADPSAQDQKVAAQAAQAAQRARQELAQKNAKKATGDEPTDGADPAGQAPQVADNAVDETPPVTSKQSADDDRDEDESSVSTQSPKDNERPSSHPTASFTPSFLDYSSASAPLRGQLVDAIA